jgi:hypothetical protein
MDTQFYDRGMAELFRHPVFIRSLLVDFVAEPCKSSRGLLGKPLPLFWLAMSSPTNRWPGLSFLISIR